jgi:hypothetical protein
MKMHSERISRLGGISERTIIEDNSFSGLENSNGFLWGCREEGAQ